MSWLPQTWLAIIAACGVWIAFQQWAIARQKLNHDLFDRRFAVYIAMHDYMVAVLNRDDDIQQKAGVYHHAIAPAPFLFDAELAEYLREVQRRGVAVTTFSDAAGRATAEEMRPQYLSKVHENQQWLARRIDNDNFTHRFQSSLNLSRLRPFAVYEILPQLDLEKVRAKVEAIFKRK